MEIVSVVHLLRRRRLAVGVGLLLAVALVALAGGLVSSGGATSGPSGGAATARVLVDTRVPLVATTGPNGQDTIVQRAVFLAVRMGSAAMTARIAQAAGIPRTALSVVAPVLPPLEVLSLVPDGQLPTLAAKDTEFARTPYVVSLNPDYTVPLIEIDTAATSPQAAVALARATITAMQEATQPAPASRTAPAPALRVSELGEPAAAPQAAAGTHLRQGLAAGIAFFVVWCIGIVIASGLARLWRGTAEHRAARSPAL